LFLLRRPPQQLTIEPPRKQQAAIINYDSDQLADAPLIAMKEANSTSTQQHSNHSPAKTANHDYATEFLAIKMEINALKAMITAVEQFKTAIATFNANPRSQSSNDMDTDVDNSTEHHHHHQPQLDLAAFIQDLKYEIATIVTESRALFKQQLLLMPHNRNHSSPVT